MTFVRALGQAAGARAQPVGGEALTNSADQRDQIRQIRVIFSLRMGMGREAAAPLYMTVGGDSALAERARSLARQSESENEECEQESFRSDTAQATAEYDL